MEAIQNPDTLYYNAGGNWNWIDNSNYWGKEKTIYDPCPAGYRVPGKEIFKNLQEKSYKKDYIREGVQFDYPDIFMPLSGIKYSEGIFYKGERGLFWSYDEGQCGSADALYIQKCIAITQYSKTEALGIIPQKYED